MTKIQTSLFLSIFVAQWIAECTSDLIKATFTPSKMFWWFCLFTNKKWSCNFRPKKATFLGKNPYFRGKQTKSKIFSYSKSLSSEGHFSSRNCKNYANRRLCALSNTIQRFFRRKRVIFSKKNCQTRYFFQKFSKCSQMMKILDMIMKVRIWWL